MTQATLQTRMTVDEFLAIPAFKNYELVDGMLMERQRMGAEASAVAANITFILSKYVRDRRLGYVFDSEAAYKCFGNDETGRRPDVSFVRRERLPDGPPRGAIPVPADLAVEVVSPSDKMYDVSAKVRVYLQAGFGCVWVVSPGANMVDVESADGSNRRLRASDPLTAETILPGFSCPVSQFFEL